MEDPSSTAIMQFKVESQILERRPEFEMAQRDLLTQIDYSHNTIKLDGTVHTINGACFQTIDPKNRINCCQKKDK